MSYRTSPGKSLMIVSETDLSPIVIEYIVDLCTMTTKINQSITYTISCMKVCKQWREAFLRRLPTMENYLSTISPISQIFQYSHGSTYGNCIFHRTTIVKAIIKAYEELNDPTSSSSLKSLLKMGSRCLIAQWCLSYHMEGRYPVFDRRDLLTQYYKIAINDHPATCPHDDPVTTDWYCIECINYRYHAKKTSPVYIEYAEEIDQLPVTSDMYICDDSDSNGFNILTIDDAWIYKPLDWEGYIMDVVTLTEQELECCRNHPS